MASNQCEQEHKQECVKDEKAILEVYNEYCRITEKSSDKQCAICQEIVWEKVDENDQLFGILNNCSHVFCFECISKWRKEGNPLEAKDNKKDCPVCKVKSDFIIASHFWFTNDDLESQLPPEMENFIYQRFLYKYQRSKFL